MSKKIVRELAINVAGGLITAVILALLKYLVV